MIGGGGSLLLLRSSPRGPRRSPSRSPSAPRGAPSRSGAGGFPRVWLWNGPCWHRHPWATTWRGRCWRECTPFWRRRSPSLPRAKVEVEERKGKNERKLVLLLLLLLFFRRPRLLLLLLSFLPLWSPLRSPSRHRSGPRSGPAAGIYPPGRSTSSCSLSRSPWRPRARPRRSSPRWG